MPIDYSKAKIYKLVNDADNEIYVGSTCQALSKRKAKHIYTSKIKENRKVYEHLNKTGWEHVDIVLIENYECKNKEQLHSRERYYIETLKASLNSQIPTRTKTEFDKKYRAENKEQIKEIQKRYRDEHKDKEKQRHKLYRDENKDKEKQRHKLYRDENKDKVKQYQKQYREANKDRIKEQRKQYREANKDKINENARLKRQQMKDQQEKEKETENKQIIAN